MAYASTTLHGAAHRFASLTHFVETQVARVQKYRLYLKTMNELSSVPARDLADMGMSKSNLRAAAYQAVYGAHN